VEEVAPGLGFFRLREDCGNVPPVGAPVPRAVLFKTHNITSPRRIALLLLLLEATGKFQKRSWLVMLQSWISLPEECGGA